VHPVLEQLERDLSLLQDLGLRLNVCLETHLHADHITAAGQLRRRTDCRLLVPAAEGIRGADPLLRGDERLQLGGLAIEVIATPGHTAEHMANRIGDSHLFSGDALLIRGCGRTDFQNGDPGQLYDSLQRLLSLPDAMLVYP
jgi:sulfur dioxygenase